MVDLVTSLSKFVFRRINIIVLLLIVSASSLHATVVYRRFQLLPRVQYRHIDCKITNQQGLERVAFGAPQ
jgi:hypothetical protein